MCRVKTFLCCVSLETFGLVYGCINLVTLAICAVLGTIKTAHFTVTSRLCKFSMFWWSINNNFALFADLAGAGIFLVIIIVTTLLGYLIISFIRGVRSVRCCCSYFPYFRANESTFQRDYKEMKGFRMLQLISILLLIIRLVASFEAFMKDEPSSEYHLAFSIFSIIVYSYFFTCINSIVMKFEDEKFPIDYPQLVEPEVQLRPVIAEVPPFNPNWKLQKAINHRLNIRQQQLGPLSFDHLSNGELAWEDFVDE